MNKGASIIYVQVGPEIFSNEHQNFNVVALSGTLKTKRALDLDN